MQTKFTRTTNLQVVPLIGRSRRIPHPLNGRPLALLEFPQHEIVFQTIGSKGQVVAVWLEVEQYARALIDAAGQSFETNRYFPFAEIRNAWGLSLIHI